MRLRRRRCDYDNEKTQFIAFHHSRNRLVRRGQLCAAGNGCVHSPYRQPVHDLCHHWFINEHYEDYATATDRKEGMIRVSGVHWFTNLDLSKRHEELILYKTYNEEDYPKYDNYDAIEVSKTNEIPLDYNGVMGVPITFMNKYNPEQFDILGLAASAGYKEEIVGIPFLGIKDARPLLNGKNTYARIFIKNKRL